MNTTEGAKASPTFDQMAKLTPFAESVCNFVLDVFDLHSGNNWLRGRAIVVLAQQILGGTMERSGFMFLTRQNYQGKY